MPTNRANFPASVKKRLAERVAHQCCFPGCLVITIGPRESDAESSVNLGEAAHIHGAAPGGPRYSAAMSEKQRMAQDNGIWMCRGHARLIDADELTYSAETLKLWKAAAEARASKKLKYFAGSRPSDAETLVCLELGLMFIGVWIATDGDAWTFVVKEFIFGDEERLRDFGRNDLLPMRRYIIVESQSEGRLLKEGIRWRINDLGEYELTVRVYDASPKQSVSEIGGDIANTYDGDLLIENGDFNIISGVELGKQLIERNLGLPLGGWRGNILMGSLFTMYYNNYRDDTVFLSRLIKIELIRLACIPPYQTEYYDTPNLNFISKIKDITVLSAFNDIVPLFITLEWAGGTNWSDTIHVPLYIPDKLNNEFVPPPIAKSLFEENPFQKLEKLTARLTGEEMKVKKNNEAIMWHFQDTLPRIMEQSAKGFNEKIYPLFEDPQLYRSIDNNAFQYLHSYDLELALIQRSVQQIGLTVNLKGFRKAGVDAFEIVNDLFIYFDDYYYAIGGSRQRPWHKKLYDTVLSDQDIKAIADQWLAKVATAINDRLSSINL